MLCEGLEGGEQHACGVGSGAVVGAVFFFGKGFEAGEEGFGFLGVSAGEKEGKEAQEAE